MVFIGPSRWSSEPLQKCGRKSKLLVLQSKIENISFKLFHYCMEGNFDLVQRGDWDLLHSEKKELQWKLSSFQADFPVLSSSFMCVCTCIGSCMFLQVEQRKPMFLVISTMLALCWPLLGAALTTCWLSGTGNKKRLCWGQKLFHRMFTRSLFPLIMKNN